MSLRIYTLPSLQRAAHERAGLTPSETLTAADELFASEVISDPRTDDINNPIVITAKKIPSVVGDKRVIINILREG